MIEILSGPKRCPIFIRKSKMILGKKTNKNNICHFDQVIHSNSKIHLCRPSLYGFSVIKGQTNLIAINLFHEYCSTFLVTSSSLSLEMLHWFDFELLGEFPVSPDVVLRVEDGSLLSHFRHRYPLWVSRHQNRFGRVCGLKLSQVGHQFLESDRLILT